MSYSKNGFLATGSGGGSSSVVSPPSGVSIPAPVTGGPWVLGGVANYDTSTSVALTTTATASSGWAWYLTQVSLDGLYIAFDAYFAIDALRVHLYDPSGITGTTNPQSSGTGIQLLFETYYQATRPSPEAGQGGYAILSSSSPNNPTRSNDSHVADTDINLSSSNTQTGPYRVEMYVRATGVGNLYHVQVWKGGRPYIDTVVAGPVGGKCYIGLSGNTGGLAGVNRVFNWTAYSSFYETYSNGSAVIAQSIARPQGTLQRRYTFDSDVQSWTTTGGTQSQTNGKLQVVGGGSTRCVALEPSTAANVADGEYYVDVYPTAGGSGITGLDDVFVIFRATDANNLYILELYVGNYSGATLPEVSLSKVVGGTFTSIVQDVPQSSSSTQQIAQQFISMPPNAAWPPLRVMVRFVGSSIQAYINESHVLSAYDTSLTTGRVGVGTGIANGYTILADNASIYSLASTWTPANYDQPAISGLQAWQAPTLTNGSKYSQYDSSYADPGYYLGPDGVVHLRGLLSGAIAAGPTTLFTLPTGYRPEKAVMCYQNSSAGAARLDVKSDGTVVWFGGSISASNVGYLSIDNISFRAFG